MENIIVGTDFSDASRRAVSWAAEIVEHTGDRLSIVHALASDPAGPDYVIAAARSDPELQRLLHAKLGEIAAPARELGIDLDTHIASGPPWKALAEVAAETSARLVAVGISGRERLARLLLGSTAAATIQHSSVPVLAVGPDHGSLRDIERVVVATNFEGEPERAAGLLGALLGHSMSRAGILLVYVEEGQRLDGLLPPGLRSGRRRGGGEAGLAGLARDLERIGLGVETRVEQGDPGEVIARIARETGAGLVVLGARRRPRIAELMVGSTAREMLPRSPCPVLTLPLGED